LQLEEQVTF